LLLAGETQLFRFSFLSRIHPAAPLPPQEHNDTLLAILLAALTRGTAACNDVVDKVRWRGGVNGREGGGGGVFGQAGSGVPAERRTAVPQRGGTASVAGWASTIKHQMMLLRCKKCFASP
jgi:hypothetical protein